MRRQAFSRSSGPCIHFHCTSCGHLCCISVERESDSWAGGVHQRALLTECVKAALKVDDNVYISAFLSLNEWWKCKSIERSGDVMLIALLWNVFDHRPVRAILRGHICTIACMSSRLRRGEHAPGRRHYICATAAPTRNTKPHSFARNPSSLLVPANGQ